MKTWLCSPLHESKRDFAPEPGFPSFKPDPLGQRKLRTVVDGDRLAAHISFPCVAAAFTAAAGFFLPAERSADFGAAGPKINICDAAVAAGRREELFGFTQVGGKNRRAQTLRHGIVECDGFL